MNMETIRILMDWVTLAMIAGVIWWLARARAEIRDNPESDTDLTGEKASSADTGRDRTARS